MNSEIVKGAVESAVYEAIRANRRASVFLALALISGALNAILILTRAR